MTGATAGLLLAVWHGTARGVAALALVAAACPWLFCVGHQGAPALRAMGAATAWAAAALGYAQKRVIVKCLLDIGSLWSVGIFPGQGCTAAAASRWMRISMDAKCITKSC